MTDKIDPCHTMRVNLIAAAVGLQKCTKTESNFVRIPGGDRVIAIGTPAQVRALLGAAPTQSDAFNAEELDEMEAVARAAPVCWYGTYQIVDGISDEKAVALIEACSPDTVLTLIAQARVGLAAAPAPAVGCGGTGKYGDLPCLGCDACPRETVAAHARALHAVDAKDEVVIGMLGTSDRRFHPLAAESVLVGMAAGADQVDSEGGHHD